MMQKSANLEEIRDKNSKLVAAKIVDLNFWTDDLPTKEENFPLFSILFLRSSMATYMAVKWD